MQNWFFVYPKQYPTDAAIIINDFIILIINKMFKNSYQYGKLVPLLNI